MATITLNYNATNSLALKTLEYILSLGVFEKKSVVEDFWTTLPFEHKADIQLGIAEIANGESVDYDILMKNYR